MADIRDSGIKKVAFSNWGRTFFCAPELFFIPKTEEEIKQILQLACKKEKGVKVVGCGHSPSDIACTDGFMISLQNFNKILDVSKDKKQVKVQAGMTLRELNEVHLPKHNLALSVIGSISDITVGGAISTGTHGSGINYGIFSTYVADMEIMNYNGDIIKCSNHENEEIFLAALCGLGCIGIILTVTLCCEPAFNLVQNQYGTELKEVIEHLDIHLQSSEHFRFTWFPYTDSVVVFHVNRTSEAVTKKLWWILIWDWILDYGLGYYTLEFCYYISTFLPSFVPYINRIFYHMVYSRSRRTVNVSHKVLNFDCLFKQHVNEWAIPKEKTGEVLWELKKLVENNSEIRAHFPVEVRFCKADNLFISPTSGRDSCYINIIMYRPFNVFIPYQKYWLAYEEIMKKADGRPHWAKAHSLQAKEFKIMYPGFNRWCHVRSYIDPVNMFYNTYINRIFMSS